MKKISLNIIKLIIWFAIVAWIAVILTDYFLVKSNKEPIFCIIKTQTIENGTTYNTCKGLGYKYYHNYNSEYETKKFIPLWKKDRDSNENK